LLAGDGDFGGFFVVHFEHEAGFEPGDDFLDVVDVDEKRAVGAPERVGVEGGVEFFQGAVVGGAFEFLGGDGDEAAFDGGEDEVLGVDEEHALLGADEDFGGLRGGGLGSRELRDELLEAFGGAGVGFDFAFGFLNGLGDAGFVEGLQDIVDSVDVEGLDGIVVEGGGEDDVGDFEFALDEFLEHAEAIEAGHLDVEEDEVGGVFFDEGDGFEAVFALADEGDFGEGLEEEGEFLAGGFFVVDDDGVDGHGKGKYTVGGEEVASGEWRGRRSYFTTEDTEGTGKRGFYRRGSRGAAKVGRPRVMQRSWSIGDVGVIEEHRDFQDRQECVCHNAKKAA
jgi:hypothetical protein